MSDRNQYLKPIMDSIYGSQLKQNIHDAIDKCHQDAIDLAQANSIASQAAKQAAQQADQTAGFAADAAARANAAKILADDIRRETEITRADLQQRMEQGYWNGAKGDKGEPGEDGDPGVTAMTAGMFTLRVNHETGDLYAVYPEDDAIPTFRYDETTGGLYYVIGEE